MLAQLSLIYIQDTDFQKKKNKENVLMTILKSLKMLVAQKHNAFSLSVKLGVKIETF